MKKPVLVIMAAGMGSRYGGLKQIDPIDPQGHLILDFSIYDAYQAGFRDVIFIIKEELRPQFDERMKDIARHLNLQYAYQQLTDLPDGFTVPEGRQKPFGTGQAVLSCASMIDGPFAVINADDYYGKEGFSKIYNFLTETTDDVGRYAMVGYRLDNTLTDNGHVARGVCVVGEDGKLQTINERTRIEKQDGGVAYTEDDGKSWVQLPPDSVVSMNLWGFSKSFMERLQQGFGPFLSENLPKNPLKCEYFLPFVVDEQLQEGTATAMVLTSADRWYGVTYPGDKQMVMDAIAKMKQEGLYPEKLWD